MIEKFLEFCENVEGYVGHTMVGSQIVVATNQEDMGENVVAVSVEPLRMCLRMLNIRARVTPLPVDGRIVYVVQIR